jgi:lysophospholipase L1-like esterase
MPSRDPAALRYVALGDSYTIGTSVDAGACWPAQLVGALARVAERGAHLELVANLAVNGRTSAELIAEQLPVLPRWQPDFVSVLIGVNDVVRGIPSGGYDANVQTILVALRSRLPPDRLITVGIPDYTVTPRGADYGEPARQRAAIVAFNGVVAARSAEHGIRHVPIFDLSSLAADDRSLVAADGLHPSLAQYGLWVERIAPVVTELLSDPRA